MEEGYIHSVCAQEDMLLIHLPKRKSEIIEKDKSIMHIEPQLLTVEDIEAHFAALKEDLSHQLKQNEQTLSEQEDTKGKK